MFEPKVLNGSVIQKADYINDNIRNIRTSLIELYGKNIDLSNSLSVYNSIVSKLITDIYSFSDIINSYQTTLNTISYTDNYSIITTFEPSYFYTTRLGSSSVAYMNEVFSSLEFQANSILPLYMIAVTNGTDTKYVPVSNIKNNIELIIESESLFIIKTNDIINLFKNDSIYVMDLTTTDNSINSAKITIRMYMTNTNNKFNKIGIVSYPEVKMEISDGIINTPIELNNGVNFVDLNPSYYIDLILTISNYTINSSGAREFLISIPYLFISNEIQENITFFGLKIPKPKYVYNISDVIIDSNIDIEYAFKLYETEDDMLNDINIIGTSELLPINLLTNSQNILKLDYIYALFTLTKKNLTDIISIKSVTFKF